jgi:hypothetical protein
MADPHEATVRDALIALHTIMPALLNIIARQNPQQRLELQSALDYAIARCGNAQTAGDLMGVAKILSIWKEGLELATRARLDS